MLPALFIHFLTSSLINLYLQFFSWIFGIRCELYIIYTRILFTAFINFVISPQCTSCCTSFVWKLIVTSVSIKQRNYHPLFFWLLIVSVFFHLFKISAFNQFLFHSFFIKSVPIWAMPSVIFSQLLKRNFRFITKAFLLLFMINFTYFLF